MKPGRIAPPSAQVFVCINQRAAGDPLASGCGTHGPAVFRGLKARVLGAGAGGRVWVTATGCLGHCPQAGCAAVVYPQNKHYIDVTPEDIPALVQAVVTPR